MIIFSFYQHAGARDEKEIPLSRISTAVLLQEGVCSISLFGGGKTHDDMLIAKFECVYWF